MSGTLSSLNTALTALRFNRVAMDAASNNIANAATEGYTRRRVDGATLGAPATPAFWSRVSDDAGSGVVVTGITRLSDALLESRARGEHAKQSYLDVRATVLERVETALGEPGTTGLSAALSDFRAAWHDLANNPASPAARGQVLARAAALVDVVHAQAANIDAEAGTQRAALLTGVADVNTAAADLAATNRAISAAALDGIDTGDLMDRRDHLALQLSEATGGSVTPRSDGTFDFTVGGVPLVTGSTARTLVVASGVTAAGAADGSPVTFAVSDGTTTTVTAALSGRLGATTDLIEVTLPAYLAGLSSVASTLADQVNTLHAGGFDSTGAPGGAFFAYAPGDAARTLSVVITDASAVASAGVPGGVVDGSIASRIAETGQAEGDYTRLVTDFGIQVSSAERQSDTQRLLTTQVDSAREQLSGVNLDEEMVNMLAAQRAYEAAARVMSTVDSVLDTLINRMGAGR